MVATSNLGELLKLGMSVSANTVATLLRREGLRPGPRRGPLGESSFRPRRTGSSPVTPHCRHDPAEDLLCAGVDRTSYPGGPPGRSQGRGPTPGESSSRSGTSSWISTSRAGTCGISFMIGLEVHRVLRRGVRLRGCSGDPNADPGTERQRFLRAVDRVGESRLAVLAARLRTKAPRVGASHVCATTTKPGPIEDWVF